MVPTDRPPTPSAQSLSELSVERRAEAMMRFSVLRPHVEDGVPLTISAREAGVALRTTQRWLARYHAHGLTGLARRERIDARRRRVATDLVELTEGLALRRPRPALTAIHRRVGEVAVR